MRKQNLDISNVSLSSIFLFSTVATTLLSYNLCTIRRIGFLLNEPNVARLPLGLNMTVDFELPNVLAFFKTLTINVSVIPNCTDSFASFQQALTVSSDNRNRAPSILKVAYVPIRYRTFKRV